MEQIIEQLIASFDISLMISITFLSYAIIKIIDISPFKNTTKTEKRIVTAVTSAVLCVIYYYIVKLPITQIIPTYLLSTVFYDIIIKNVLKKLKISYTKKDE